MNTITVPTDREKIRTLNDNLRRTFQGGRVMMTAQVSALPAMALSQLLSKVRVFNSFSEDNDPHRRT